MSLWTAFQILSPWGIVQYSKHSQDTEDRLEQGDSKSPGRNGLRDTLKFSSTSAEMEPANEKADELGSVCDGEEHETKGTR